MTCPYCYEPILPGEPVSLATGEPVHRECVVRMIAGSVAHQLEQCPCFGGTRGDPDGLSYRESALAAFALFQARAAARAAAGSTTLH